MLLYFKFLKVLKHYYLLFNINTNYFYHLSMQLLSFEHFIFKEEYNQNQLSCLCSV